jgi:RNA-directed DNA polymerase
MPFGKSIKTWLQMPTIGVVRSTMQQTHSTSTSTTATRTTTIRQILIVCVPFGILQQNNFQHCRAIYPAVFFKNKKMQLSLFDIPQPKIELEELFEAYFECRKNKRNTANALAFEIDYENNLVQLCEDINNGTYQIGRSIAFIVDKPVKREIFAADFRDRVMHHLVIGKLNHLFEKQFIYDSYSCRVDKGTHFGIQRLDKFIRQCSANYTKDCYILKLDLQGFFMSINKNILFEKLENFINEKYEQSDKVLIIKLCKQVIFNDPTKKCIIKGNRTDWNNLPQNKSLFHSKPNCGLPIGNLTSQVFANFYMDSFDHFVKHDLKIRYYGRYVDDFVIVHEDNQYLKNLIPKLSEFLQTELQTTIHPKKIYLQHYSKGVKFLGTVILPNRIYIADRTKGNFYNTIERQNQIARNHKPTKEEQQAFQSSMNSYLGIMKHYKSYKLRKEMIFKNLSAWWWNYVYLSGGIAKFEMKTKTV